MITKPFIFFDLGGVLLLEADKSVKKDERFAHINLFRRTFEFAHHLYNHDVKDAWFLGTLTSEELLKTIEQSLDEQAHNPFFVNIEEQLLVRNGCRSFLDPQQLVNNTFLIPQGLACVKKCKDAGIEIGIISNWEPYSFKILQNKFPELFSLFKKEYIILPYNAGAPKPSLEIFEYALAVTGQQAFNCIFIDDVSYYADAAEKCGFTTIVHTDWKITEQALRELGIKI